MGTHLASAKNPQRIHSHVWWILPSEPSSSNYLLQHLVVAFRCAFHHNSPTNSTRLGGSGPSLNHHSHSSHQWRPQNHRHSSRPRDHHHHNCNYQYYNDNH